jgi:hypothetical protein
VLHADREGQQQWPAVGRERADQLFAGKLRTAHTN